MQNISIPKGMRDFGVTEMLKRNYIFDTIESVFRLYTFSPIQTPSMENLSVLLGKYGEEGDKLLFRVQNSGAKMNEPPEKGLRYDLTVPLARYVVQHRNEIIFPFKRYQIQPVWRADRPQKGRYREFYQCDADIVGTRSIIAETELIQMVRDVFRRLNIAVTIKINSRKVLSAIAEYIGEKDKLSDLTIAIDKLDKCSFDVVRTELLSRGIKEKSVSKLETILLSEGGNDEKLDTLYSYFKNDAIGREGIEEVRYVVDSLKSIECEKANECEIHFDSTLARGLNYYTGIIFEVKAKGVSIGSIAGGGRYDNLCHLFGVPDIAAVGLSFGADRIYDVMEELNLFPSDIAQVVQVLFIALSEKELPHVLSLANKLRNNNIAVEVIPEIQKMNKSLSYANKKHIPYVAIVGQDEIDKQCVTLKDMEANSQQMVSYEQLQHFFQNP